MMSDDMRTDAEILADIMPEPLIPFQSLTKREHFAAMAMQGLIMRNEAITGRKCAPRAIEFADALLEALTDE